MHFQQAGCWPTPLQQKLLRAALCEGEAARVAWAEWRALPAGELRDGAQLESASQRLLPLVAHNLLRQGVTDPLLTQFAADGQRASRRAALTAAHGAALVRDLQSAGIPALVFKGAALAPVYYRDLSLRPMNDFDILVAPHQMLPAFESARQRGWVANPPLDFASLSPARVQQMHGHGFQSALGCEVDVHRRLWHFSNESLSDEEFWAASVPLRIFDVETRTLCASDQLLVTLVHGVRWDDIAPIRWIADALTILRVAGDELDWERLLRHTQLRGVSLPVTAGLRYLRDNFDEPIPEWVLRRLDSMPVRAHHKWDFQRWTTAPENHPPLLRIYNLAAWFWRRQSPQDMRGKLMLLPLHLKKHWRLRSLWAVPFVGYARGVRLLRAHLQRQARLRRSKAD